MTPLEKVTRLLGGQTVLGKDIRGRVELIGLLREGLPYVAMEVLSGILGFSMNRLAAWLRLPRRTLFRRRGHNRLDPHESERIFRLANIAASAFKAFGNLQDVREWLTSDNRALDDFAPITLLDTDVGARAVEEVLLRIGGPSYVQPCVLCGLTSPSAR